MDKPCNGDRRREEFISNCSFRVCLWLLACWDCGFESHRGHECLSVVSVEFCQAEVSVRRADHSSRGVLPNVVRLSVIVKPR